MFKTKKSKINGCIEIFSEVFEDNRGSFVKVYHKPMFQELGIQSNFEEEYYSRSYKNVIRGLHFQNPPHAHDKIVYCSDGHVFDVIVDLRKGSPSFGQYDTFELSPDYANMIFMPKGIAHGFCSMSDTSTLVYKTSTVYNPSSDSGVLWNSLGIKWPVSSFIISDRDKKFSNFDSFKSPF